MIQRITALDSVRIPGTAGRSFQEILENKTWGTASVPAARPYGAEPIPERRPLPPTREELEEMLESDGVDSFLARLAGVLKAGGSSGG